MIRACFTICGLLKWFREDADLHMMCWYWRICSNICVRFQIKAPHWLCGDALWFIKQMMFPVVKMVQHYPDSKVHGDNMGPPGSCRPQMGPMLGIWTLQWGQYHREFWSISPTSPRVVVHLHWLRTGSERLGIATPEKRQEAIPSYQGWKWKFVQLITAIQHISQAQYMTQLYWRFGFLVFCGLLF